MNENYQGKKVLITGGLGFIGSNLAIQLVELGADVTLVDSMIPAYGANLFNVDEVKDRIQINFSDVRDQHSLDYLVRDQDIIFSLAGQVSHLQSMQDPMTDLEINSRSQLSLLECCRKQNPNVKIVFSSTRQIYGKPQYLPVDEEHPLVPVDVNGVNKLAAEMYYSLYHRVYGMRTVLLRLTNTYGPRMDIRNLNKGFVGVFVRKALVNHRIELFGTGEQLRDFNYVDDVCEAFLLAGLQDELNGQVFNLGHPDHHSLIDFVKILQKYSQLEYSCVPFPEVLTAIDVGDYYGDFSKFQTITGWSPRVGLDEGLAETVKYFQEYQQHYL